MYHKTLYSNEDIQITSLAALLPGKDTSSISARFLANSESESFLLLVGTASGVLQSLEVQLHGENFRVSMEKRNTVLLKSPTGAQEEISFLFGLREPLSLVLAVLGNQVLLLESGSLQIRTEDRFSVSATTKIVQMTAQEESEECGDVRRFAYISKDKTLQLLEVSAQGVQRMAEPISLEEYEVTSLTWMGGVLFVGTVTDYLLYDTHTFSLLYKLDIREQDGSRKHPPMAQGMHLKEDAVKYNFTAVEVDTEEEVPNGISWLNSEFSLLFTASSQLYAVELPPAVEDVDLMNALPVDGTVAGVSHLLAVYPFVLAVQGDRMVPFLVTSDRGHLRALDNRQGVNFSSKVNLQQHVRLPFGVLVFSPHTIEAAVWQSFSHQLQTLVGNGWFSEAVFFFNRFAVSEDGDETEELVEELYKSCGDGAWARARYEEAYQYYFLSGVSPTLPLRNMPELLPESRSAGLAVEVTPEGRQKYEPLFQYLKHFWFLSYAGEAGVPELPPEERTALEYAMIVLSVYFVEKSSSNDETNPRFIPLHEAAVFILESRFVDVADCAHLIKAEGSNHLLPFAVAKEGKVEEALTQCQDDNAAECACLILSELSHLSSSTTDTGKWFQAHLPWIAAADVEVLLQFVTTVPNFAPPLPVAFAVFLGVSGLPLYRYLGHLIDEMGNTTAKYHTTHAVNMIEILVQLSSYLLPESADSMTVPLEGAPLALSDVGLLDSVRQSLRSFLRTSTHYNIDDVMIHLRAGRFYEEQVIVLEKNGDHIGALSTLVYDLNDIAGAEEYCERLLHSNNHGVRTGGHSPLHYEKSESEAPDSDSNDTSLSLADESRWDVVQWDFSSHRGSTARGAVNPFFHLLLNVLLVSPDGHTPRTKEAEALLNQHGSEMDMLLVLSTLPGDMCFSDIAESIIHVLRAHEQELLLSQMQRGAVEGVLEEAVQLHHSMLQRFVCIDTTRRCARCDKLLCEESALIAVYPNLKTTHLRCQCDPRLDPERGVPYTQPV
ncbi:Vacuolar sorting protein 39 domain 2, putative [Angomonas deanei]|uniref:Vacuolar sorting protein 39 domain 2, putative n=1 Tax=Angomonas deanei TaxID=59799 RepID=A0A7G2CHX7_9TRYP|nr:Vacuolar sorting protein 39 domain 2, putative [Angomonas deanei]